MNHRRKRAPQGGGPQAQGQDLLVHDHPIVRNGLEQLINQEKTWWLQAVRESAADALAESTSRLDPATVDISLKSTNGIELTKPSGPAIRCPRSHASMHDEVLYAERALRAGAGGYIMKAESPANVLRAIREVLAGELYVSAHVATRLLSGLLFGGDAAIEASGVGGLSDRELEVFEQLGRGRSTRDIAKRLGISVKTVETHRAHIKRKLHVKTATELLQYAVNWVAGKNGEPS